MAADADEQRDVSRAMGVVQQILATDTSSRKRHRASWPKDRRCPRQPRRHGSNDGVPALYTASEGTDPAAYREPVFRGEGGVGMFDSCEIPDPNEFLASGELDPSSRSGPVQVPGELERAARGRSSVHAGVVFQKTPGGDAIREIDSDSPLYGKLAVGGHHGRPR